MSLRVGVYAQPKNHRFGEKVTLAPDATLVVTKLNISQFRTRYASEFPSTIKNLVAYKFRSEGSGKASYVYWTDRANAANSDIAVVCDSERINILRVGGGAFSNPDAYEFGSPGAFQIKGRWASVGAFGAVPTVLFFSLPDGCNPEKARLSVKLEVARGQEKTNHLLVFSDR